MSGKYFESFDGAKIYYHKTEKGEIARKILYACQKLMVNCCAITSEDSQMFRGLPEDRFGFIKENFQPCREDPCESYQSKPAMYVIELNAGTIEKLEIRNGDIINFSLIK